MNTLFQSTSANCLLCIFQDILSVSIVLGTVYWIAIVIIQCNGDGVVRNLVYVVLLLISVLYHTVTNIKYM